MAATALSRPVVRSIGSSSTMLDRPVRSFMRSGVVVVPEEASVRRAQKAMLTHDVGAVLVVGRVEGRPLGWVTDRGLLECLDADTALIRVSALVAHPPELIDPGATAAQAAVALTRSPGAPLLVMRPGDVVPEGSVTERELLRLDMGA